jgi:hypothetical protein
LIGITSGWFFSNTFKLEQIELMRLMGGVGADCTIGAACATSELMSAVGAAAACDCDILFFFTGVIVLLYLRKAIQFFSHINKKIELLFFLD